MKKKGFSQTASRLTTAMAVAGVLWSLASVGVMQAQAQQFALTPAQEASWPVAAASVAHGIDQALTAINDTATGLATKASAARLTNLENVVNDTATGLATKASAARVTNLENVVNDTATGLATKASAARLTNLENVVNDTATGLATKASAARLTNLENVVNDTATGLATKASAARLTNLENVVNDTATGLATKASAARLTNLENVVNDTATGLATKASAARVTNLENTVANKADKATTYNKTEVDTKLADKADKTYVDDKLKSDGIEVASDGSSVSLNRHSGTGDTVALGETGSEIKATKDSASVMVTNALGNQHGLAVGTGETTLSGGQHSTELKLNDDGAAFSNTAGTPVKVTGIANGTTDFDAVNFHQLREAYAGIAGIGALAAIPAPANGYTNSIGVGTSYYKGISALALGYKGQIGESKNLTVNAGFSTTMGKGLKAHSLFNAGVGYSW